MRATTRPVGHAPESPSAPDPGEIAVDEGGYRPQMAILQVRALLAGRSPSEVFTIQLETGPRVPPETPSAPAPVQRRPGPAPRREHSA